MGKNLSSNNTIGSEIEENNFFILSESTIIFKNDNQRIKINLDQTTNVRLIKNRDFKINIIVILLAALFYLTVLQTINLDAIFQNFIVALLTISVIVNTLLRNYSYKLLINNKYNNYQEILVSKTNLYYAKIFLSKFSGTDVKKNKVNPTIAFNYQNIGQNIA